MSDQSDIESRIKALKEELRKRKFMAYQLKKEQKKRHKERLKAQEASLLKQLEVNVYVCEGATRWLFGLGLFERFKTTHTLLDLCICVCVGR